MDKTGVERTKEENEYWLKKTADVNFIREAIQDYVNTYGDNLVIADHYDHHGECTPQVVMAFTEIIKGIDEMTDMWQFAINIPKN